MSRLRSVSLRVEIGHYYKERDFRLRSVAAMKNTSWNFKKAYIDSINLLGRDFPAVFPIFPSIPALCFSSPPLVFQHIKLTNVRIPVVKN